MSQSQQKIDAIYELREAVEAKTRLEVAVDNRPSPAAREALLDATLDVEARTQHAIEVCHECGHVHAADRLHGEAEGNLIRVDFGRPDESETDGGRTGGGDAV